MERHHANNKSITKLVDDDGIEISGIENVLNEEFKFYSTLYTSQSTDINAQEALTQMGLLPEDISKLTENNSVQCDGILRGHNWMLLAHRPLRTVTLSSTKAILKT